MLGLLNCVYTARYEWHEITINDMKYNPVRIIYDLRIEGWETIWHEWWTISETIWKMIWYVHNVSGVVLKDNENEKVLGPHALCVLMHLGGYPYPITRVRTRTSNGRTTIVMLCIALPWRLLVLASVWPKGLPEYAHRVRKVAQQCAN